MGDGCSMDVDFRKNGVYSSYIPAENLSNEELIKEEYRGIRPAPGYFTGHAAALHAGQTRNGVTLPVF
jgi:hypothetical protein